MVSVFMRNLRSAVDQANRNQVSVYSIDPRGTMTFPVEMSGYFDTADLEASLEFLANLSEDTGGLLFANENDLSRPIQAAYRDKDSYYKTVGPSLEAKWPEDGRSLVVVLRQRLSGKLSAVTHNVGRRPDSSP